ncbi:MAG: exonuclease SbcCD subunit D C-terminal domain-containing protein, partial [Victivallales bacterium]|nr:exonuclease SbcCD subunit D C-terminal domain-containing protein [Victivallales bacterium]
GGKTADGDGVRELYIGSLAHVDAGIFPVFLDYVALGHLHVPQKVGGRENVRYSGSMIPMGFGETGRTKSVVIVDLGGDGGGEDENRTNVLECSISNIQVKRGEEEAEKRGNRAGKENIEHSTFNVQHRMGEGGIRLVSVPVFQQLERISGDMDAIRGRIEALKAEKSGAWLEIDYTGSEIAGSLREFLDEVTEGSNLEILAVRNRKVVDRALSQSKIEETLDDLNENEVFERCLNAYDVPKDQRVELTAAYREVLEKVMNPVAVAEDSSVAVAT